MMNSQGRYYQTSSTTVHLTLNEDDLSWYVPRLGQAILSRSNIMASKNYVPGRFEDP